VGLVIIVFHKVEKGQTELHKLLGYYLYMCVLILLHYCANSVEFI